MASCIQKVNSFTTLDSRNVTSIE